MGSIGNMLAQAFFGGVRDGAVFSCNCMGPRNGQPLCPCMMRGVTIENGRYIQKRDLGPAPPSPERHIGE
jgi:hypothetical protein